MSMFVVHAEILPFCLPESKLNWSALIPIHGGPVEVLRPVGLVLTHEEQFYVFLQGVLENGNQEHIYIPHSHAHKIHIVEIRATIEVKGNLKQVMDNVPLLREMCSGT